MTTRDERDALEHFQERYSVPTNELTDQVEEKVIGARWGANGYTTLRQADELARRLRLGSGVRVLDVGTGRGWPGVYFAVAYGCDVIGSDMPIDGLSAAARRARQEGAAARFAAIVAAGINQPFRPSSFDAVVHTDVLC
jgi:2-polyprenyl-3-methyl-5-hydroxy-6-metoxy-1,4-benzoquinol methylase